MAENRFKSRFTGTEIENLLVRAQSSLSSNSVTDSYKEGLPDTIFSGAGAKNLYNELLDKTSGETLKNAIESIPGVAIFTEDNKTKLNKVSDKFVGGVNDIATRNSIDTSLFTGNEIIFVRSDSFGNPMFFYWDNINLKWEEAIDDGISNELSFPGLSIGTHSLKTFAAGSTTCLKFIVHSRNGSNVHSAEVLINTNYSNVYYTTYADIKSNPLQPIFNLYAELDANLNIILKADVFVANSTLKITKLAEL